MLNIFYGTRSILIRLPGPSELLFEDSLKIISSAIFGNYFLKCLQSFIMSVSEQQFFFIEHCFYTLSYKLISTQKIKIKGHSLNVILNKKLKY